MEIGVESRSSVGRLRETWFKNVKTNMAQLEIDREDIRDRKNWRGSPTPSETDYKPIIIIIVTSF